MDNKKCAYCGAEVPADEENCPNCGADAFVGAELSAEGAEEQKPDVFAPAPQPEVEKNENIAAGIAGAFLFSLGGALCYFGVYQIGFIAGICGFVIFFLANLGYGIFCGDKQSVSAARIVVSVIMTLVMILLAEYVCIAFELYKEFKAEGFTFFDCLRVIPYLFEDSEFTAVVVKDVIISLMLSAVAVIPNVIRMIKARKAKLSK